MNSYMLYLVLIYVTKLINPENKAGKVLDSDLYLIENPSLMASDYITFTCCTTKYRKKTHLTCLKLHCEFFSSFPKRQQQSLSRHNLDNGKYT